MSVNAISQVGNISFKSSEIKSEQKSAKNESLKSAGLSYDVSNALKAQVLYQRPNGTQYLDSNLDKKGIINALKDKNKMGRSFFGYKSRVASIITKADDTKLATDNFNVLMNAQNKDGKKLHAADVTDILMVATSINNKKMNEKLSDEYGFHGGILDKKAIDSILDKITEQREQQQFAMMQQQMIQQRMMDDMFMQQMMMQQQQQMMLDQQMHQQALQQHMMTTPGMGFC